ncbi:molybdate ABC transporter substrate-binding protein [Roseibium aestuarii]|uniref:Molybdate ABC transporter substrate-binding protein n=1 Tax=Roseibium aestuarii TaxID=2600299 RepID=A0ABW4JZ42_9HYPH|nr:molybdate ABC transporter substrate-binding protein [Roseibium aestuarii]
MLKHSRPLAILTFVLTALWTGQPNGGAARAEEPLTILAAASLTDALTEIGAAWARAGHPAPVFSFAGTGTLARQLDAGAPADLFVSADQAWMDHAEEQGTVAADSIVEIAANALVLVGAPEAEPLAAPLTLDAVLGSLGTGRLAIAEPESVPAGRYARQAFETLGYWSALEPRLAPMDNVRVALATVARGETPLGVVYGSDAVIEPGVRVLATLPNDSHTPITYPAAVTPEAQPEAGAFLDFLTSPEAVKILESKGFLTLNGR